MKGLILIRLGKSGIKVFLKDEKKQHQIIQSINPERKKYGSFGMAMPVLTNVKKNKYVLIYSSCTIGNSFNTCVLHVYDKYDI